MVRNVVRNDPGYFSVSVCEMLLGHCTKLGGGRLATKLNKTFCQSGTPNVLWWPTWVPPHSSSWTSSLMSLPSSLFSSSSFSLPSSIRWWQWWRSHSFWASASWWWVISSCSCTACLNFSVGWHIWPESLFFLTFVSSDLNCYLARLTSTVLFISGVQDCIGWGLHGIREGSRQLKPRMGEVGMAWPMKRHQPLTYTHCLHMACL